MHTIDDDFLFAFCKYITLNHKFPRECGRWQNINLLIYMYSKSRFLCVFRRIVKARKAYVAQCNCIVTLCIVIYVDKCIRWETNQKCSSKTLVGSVIASVLASSAVDRGFESPDRVKPKTIKLVFVNSPLSTQHWGERTKTGWLGIKIMSTHGLLYQWASVYYKNPTKRVGLEQSGPRHHLIEN